MNTPADELKAAADKLRGLAASMAEQHPGPWTVHNPNGYPQAVFSPASDVILCETLDEIDQPKPTAPYIAAMDPGVGTALAEWLEHHAAMTERLHALVEGVPQGDTHPALAVARAINGTTP